MATRRLGRLALLKIDINNVGGAGASWSSIPLRKDASVDESSNTVDGTTVENAGWPSDVPTGQKLAVSCTAYFDPADPVHVFIRSHKRALTTVFLQIDESGIGGIKEEVQAYVTKYSKKYALEGLIELDLEFSPQGAPVTSAV
jgi:hypothetical protein